MINQKSEVSASAGSVTSQNPEAIEWGFKPFNSAQASRRSSECILADGD